jgi:hypothetical protein
MLVASPVRSILYRTRSVHVGLQNLVPKALEMRTTNPALLHEAHDRMVNVPKGQGGHTQPLMQEARLVRQRHVDKLDVGKHGGQLQSVGTRNGLARPTPGSGKAHHDEFLSFVRHKALVIRHRGHRVHHRLAEAWQKASVARGNPGRLVVGGVPMGTAAGLLPLGRDAQGGGSSSTRGKTCWSNRKGE